MAKRQNESCRRSLNTKRIDMAKHDDFLNPLCSPKKLDTFIGRRAILNAVTREMPRFSGTVLDLGCGVMPYKTLLQQQPAVTKYIGLDLPGNPFGKPDLEWD